MLIACVCGASMLGRATNAHSVFALKSCVFHWEDGHLESDIDLNLTPPTKIQRDQVRLVVFNEQDQRLLYDSETVVCVNDRLCTDAKLSKCGRFQFMRRRQDVSTIGSLVFGTLSTSTKKGSMKIHMVEDSLILSRIFSVPKGFKLNNSLDLSFPTTFSDFDSHSQYHATIRSLDALFRDDQSCRGGSVVGRVKNSMDPPTMFSRVRNTSLQLDGLSYDEQQRMLSPNKLSRMRRKQMSWKGLVGSETGGSSFYLGSRSRLSSCSSSVNDCEDTLQIGFALVFSIDEKDFIFQHILQVEEEIGILELGVYAATLTKRQFLQSIYTAYVKFCDSICLLHNANRLKTPVWLSLMDTQLQTDTARQFCDQLAVLIERLDQKETNFFISTLLSAVLTNHLAWVASVAPPDNLPENVNGSLLIGTNVIETSKNPYNANLAQFLELCGTVGMGCRLAKTVVIGTEPQLISQILFILSYFIRCSNVESKLPTNPSPTPPITQEEDVLPEESQSSDLPDNPIEPLVEENKEQSTYSSVPIRTSASFDEKRTHVSLKRHSSSMSASSPPPPPSTSSQQQPQQQSSSSASSQQSQILPSSQIFCSSSQNDSQIFQMEIDNCEPPQKTRVICHPSEMRENCANEFRCLLPSATNSNMKLMMDTKDVRATANELAASTFSGSFPNLANSQLNDSQSTSSSSALSFPLITNELSKSLLAGVCETYSPYFILSGIETLNSDYISSLIYDDVKRHSCSRQSWCPHGSSSSSQSTHYQSPPLPADSLKHSPSSTSNSLSKKCAYVQRDLMRVKIESRTSSTNQLCADSPRSQDSSDNRSGTSSSDDCVAAVIVVVGDLNHHTIRAISADGPENVEDQLVVSPSESVINMLEQFLILHQMGSDTNFLISYLEDQLGAILAKSKTLVEMVSTADTSRMITKQLKQMNAFSKPSSSDLLKIGSHASSSSSNGSSSFPNYHRPCSSSNGPTSNNFSLNFPSPPIESSSSIGHDSIDGHPSRSGFQTCFLDSLMSTSSTSHRDEEIDEEDVVLNEDEEEIEDEAEEIDRELMSMQKVSSLLGCDCSDLRLILNVAAVYNPPVLLSVL